MADRDAASREQEIHDRLDEEFDVEDGIQAFAASLASDELDAISAATDWAPIHTRIKRLSGLKAGERAGWAYDLSRWPLLALIWFLISTEFLLYIGVRQIVNFLEYSTYWWGRKNKLRRALRDAGSYEEWKSAALRMDDRECHTEGALT
jgi:hypothetical protein